MANNTQQDIYMHELAVRAIVQDIEAAGTLLVKNAQSGGREYSVGVLGDNLQWTSSDPYTLDLQESITVYELMCSFLTCDVYDCVTSINIRIAGEYLLWIYHVVASPDEVWLTTASEGGDHDLVFAWEAHERIRLAQTGVGFGAAVPARQVHIAGTSDVVDAALVLLRLSALSAGEPVATGFAVAMEFEVQDYYGDLYAWEVLRSSYTATAGGEGTAHIGVVLSCVENGSETEYIALRPGVTSTVHRVYAYREAAFLRGIVVNPATNDYDSVFSGDTLSHMLYLDASAATENIALLAASAPNWQTMDRGVFLGDCSNAPSAAPAGGLYLYGVSGDLHYYAPAQKTLVLDQPVYKDTNVGGMLLSKPASSAPGLDTFRTGAGTDTGIETLAFAPGEYVSGVFELQHDYKEGTDLVFHVHWQGITPPGGTDNVQWQLDYMIARADTAPSGSYPALVTTTVEVTFNARYKFKRSDFPSIAGATSGPGTSALLIGDQLAFKLTRIAASTDEYAGDALVQTVGIHYQIDTIGSRQIGVK